MEALPEFSFHICTAFFLLCFGVMMVSCEYHVNSPPWKPHVSVVLAKDTHCNVVYEETQQTAFRWTVLLSVGGW